jgi:hypothetical protein
MSFATATFSRQRFELIANQITFDDNNESIRREKKKSSPKFFKMEEIWNIWKKNIGEILNPSSFLCVDETLYAARLRCQFIQYMKSKPAKYGIKYWCLVDVTTRYLLAVDIYLGKNSSNDKNETQVGMKAV